MCQSIPEEGRCICFRQSCARCGKTGMRSSTLMCNLKHKHTTVSLCEVPFGHFAIVSTKHMGSPVASAFVYRMKYTILGAQAGQEEAPATRYPVFYHRHGVSFHVGFFLGKARPLGVRASLHAIDGMVTGASSLDTCKKPLIICSPLKCSLTGARIFCFCFIHFRFPSPISSTSYLIQFIHPHY